jgi:transcriptional regulator with XRE-family HTH domain
MQAVELAGIGLKQVESLIRQALSNPNKQEAVLRETGWDVTMLSKVKSGQAGITIDKLDALVRALELVVTTASYMDYLAEGNVIGSNCRCARMSMGQCGR